MADLLVEVNRLMRETEYGQPITDSIAAQLTNKDPNTPKLSPNNPEIQRMLNERLDKEQKVRLAQTIKDLLTSLPQAGSSSSSTSTDKPDLPSPKKP